jgi:hypothetical protein
VRLAVGVICVVDGLKAEVEIKLLLGCSSADIVAIRDFFSRMHLGAVVWLRGAEEQAPTDS